MGTLYSLHSCHNIEPCCTAKIMSAAICLQTNAAARLFAACDHHQEVGLRQRHGGDTTALSDAEFASPGNLPLETFCGCESNLVAVEAEQHHIMTAASATIQKAMARNSVAKEEKIIVYLHVQIDKAISNTSQHTLIV